MKYKNIVINTLLNKQKNKCGLCEKVIVEDDVLDINHIGPQGYIGKDEIVNLMVCHTSCHRKRKYKNNQNKAFIPKKSRSTDIVELQKSYGELLLLKQIQDKRTTLRDACQELSVSENRVLYFMKKHGIKGHVNTWPKIQLKEP